MVYIKTEFKAVMLKSLVKISLVFLLAITTFPVAAQFITTTDNENESLNGGDPDGDLDTRFFIYNKPIEFSITTTGIPTEDVKLAIRAYDVDALEDVGVKINGTYIGKLRGKSGEWVVSILDVPLTLWVEGKNYVEIYDGGNGTNPYIKVDWGQLIVDCGTCNGAKINDFELDHFSFYEDGFFDIEKWRLYTTANIEVTSGSYSIQVQLIEYGIAGNEQFQDINQATISSTQEKTITLNYRNDNLTQKYTCRALLINSSTQEVVDYQEFNFHHTYKRGPDPFYMEFTNSTNKATQDNVVITCSKFKNYNSLPFRYILLPDGSTTTNTAFSYTATSNGTYKFIVVSTDTTSYSFAHTITNIDRTSPVITLFGSATETIVEEGTYTDAGAKASDNYDGEISSSIITESNVNTLIPGTYTVTYNVPDQAGNAATQVERQVVVTNKPLEVNTTSPTQTTTDVTFNGNLVYLGSSSITEHGFVWSYLPNPTLDVNIGECELGTISEKSAFQYTTTSLEMGATYHVRSFAINAEGTVYGNDVEFTYNGINYGTLSIENSSYSVDEGNSVTITVTRTGGTERSITVDYTTLDGNALGGTNYTSKSGTFTFAEGESSKTITINTTSNSSYTGEKRFYFQLDNISNGAINLDLAYVIINDLESKPNYILGSNVVTHGTGDNGFRSLSLGTNGYQGWGSSNSFEKISGSFYNSSGDVNNSYYVYINQGDLNIKDLADSGQIKVTASLRGKSEKETGDDDACQLYIYVGSTEIGYDVTTMASNGWITLSRTNSTDIMSSDFVRLRVEGWISGLWDNDLNAYYDDLTVQFDDIVAPTIEDITSNTGDYIYNDKIYIAVTLTERVKVSSATLTLNTGNSTEGTATCIAGGETDCLLFEYSVRDGDNKENIVVTDISGVTDYQPNNLDETGIPYTLTGVNVDGILPTITFTAQDVLSNWETSHSIKIEVTNSSSQKYVWSDSESIPGAGWTAFSSGDIQSIKSGDGQWYLHAYAARDNGNSKYVTSSVVNLDNTDPGIAFTTSPTEWINSTVAIAVTVDDLHPGTITDPSGNSSSNTTTYSISTNGTYLFTAADEAGNSATDSISISNIENINPIITISKNGSGGEWVDMARTIVTVEDEDSGIDSFEYLWDSNSGTPESGWQTYNGTSTFLNDNKNGTRYLHIRATDIAGNSTVSNSLAYYIDNVKPELTLTYTNPTDWTNSDVEVAVSATKSSGQQLEKIILPDGSKIEASSGTASGSLTIEENGLYDFSAVDYAGNFTDSTVLITKIDKEVPIIQYQLSNSEWTNSSVTLTLSLDDNSTPIYNIEGEFVGYSSSGDLQIKENDGEFTPYSSEITKIITENTSLTYEAKDALGNTTFQTIEINIIDKNGPDVAVSSTDYNWHTSDFQIQLTFTDEEQGSVTNCKYAVATTMSTPSSYSSYTVPVEFSTDGIFYLHYYAADDAGNDTTGYFGPYKLDKTAPVDFAAIISNVGAAAITVSGTSSDDVSGLHDTESYLFAIDGAYGNWQTGNEYEFTSLTANKSHSFKMMAKNNVGLTTETEEVSKYTLALDPSVEIESNKSTELKFTVTHDSDNATEPYCYYELKAKGAGASGTNVQTIYWTTGTSLTFDGLTAGTHYELWATTRNVENVENTKFIAVADAVTNRPPVANNTTYVVAKGHMLTVSSADGVLSNDTDPDDNNLTAVLQTGPGTNQGTLTLNTDGSFTFTPADCYTGDVTFTYMANDGFVNSESVAIVTISVVIPTWNGTGLYTTIANWNVNELPGESDEVICESGEMIVNSEVSYAKLTITGGSVLVKSTGILILSTCDYSGDVLQAENGGQIIIAGDIYSNDVKKLKIGAGIKINKAIKLPKN